MWCFGVPDVIWYHPWWSQPDAGLQLINSFSIHLLPNQFKTWFSMDGKWGWGQQANILFSVITSRLGSSVLIRLGNDAFDIYSSSTSIPDALVVCSLFYWAWWVSLSLPLSSMAASVATVMHPPDGSRCVADEPVDASWQCHGGRRGHRLPISHYNLIRVQIRSSRGDPSAGGFT